MEEEVAVLKQDMENCVTETVAGMQFVKGKLEGKEAVVVRSGIGKVNAAACTQLLIYRYQVDCIINTGIAGSLENQIDIGDIVLSVDAVQHDVDVSAFGYQPGEIPRIGRLEFCADERLRTLARELNEKVNPDIRTFEGRVASGDQFISDGVKKEWIKTVFAADCCEMEGAAIAQVCTQNQIPFLIVRAISDKADQSASVDYPTFERQAIRHCVRLTKALTAAY